MATKDIVTLTGDQGVGNRAPTDSDLLIGESSAQVPFNFTGSQLQTYVGISAGANVTVVTFSSGDTRAAIQSAIDTATTDFVSSGAVQTIRLEAGRVYEVSQTGNAATFRSNTPIRYGLVMKSGVILDGNNSTIRQQNGQNCFVIINEAITTNVGSGPTQRDEQMGLINLKVDGNRANQNGFEDLDATPAYSEQGGIALQAIDRSFIHNFEVNSSQCYGAKIVDAIECQFSELRSNNVRGDVYAFGLQQESAVPLEMVRCTVGNGVVEGAEQGYSFPDSSRSNIQGNPFITCAVDSTFGDWTASDCGGGYKIENRSLNSGFGTLIFVGGPNGTVNSGVKIQGFAGGRPDGITIAAVIGKSCDAEVMRFTECENCHVSSIIAEDCATNTGFNQEVFFNDALGCSVGNYKSTNSNADTTLIQVQGGSQRLQFGQVNVEGHTVDLIALNTAATTTFGSVMSIGGNNRIFNHNATGSAQITTCEVVMTSQATFAPDAAGGTVDVRSSFTSIT